MTVDRYGLTNNTPTNLDDFFMDIFLACVKNNTPLPEEIADLFVLTIHEGFYTENGVQKTFRHGVLTPA